MEIRLVHTRHCLLHDDVDLKSYLLDHLPNPSGILLSEGLHSFHILHVILLQKLQHQHIIVHLLYVGLSVLQDSFSLVDFVRGEGFGVDLELQQEAFGDFLLGLEEFLADGLPFIDDGLHLIVEEHIVLLGFLVPAIHAQSIERRDQLVDYALLVPGVELGDA